jgi:hypothetical protein
MPFVDGKALRVDPNLVPNKTKHLQATQKRKSAQNTPFGAQISGL